MNLGFVFLYEAEDRSWFCVSVYGTGQILTELILASCFTKIMDVMGLIRDSCFYIWQLTNQELHVSKYFFRLALVSCSCLIDLGLLVSIYPNGLIWAYA